MKAGTREQPVACGLQPGDFLLAFGVGQRIRM
jgi:hypothetical protein